MKAAVPALLDKAERALASAALLLSDGDADGACNRAYYAMYDSASAALLHHGYVLPKTHAGVVAALGLKLVVSGVMPKAIGASLNRVQRMREIADYTGDGVELEEAEVAVEDARRFVACVQVVVERV